MRLHVQRLNRVIPYNYSFTTHGRELWKSSCFDDIDTLVVCMMKVQVSTVSNIMYALLVVLKGRPWN